ncbi:MAG: flagellar filament capping protein FliD, partial [Rubrivivax sp.]|nr:flagellar filament capping protein FliD [Rubrivivax sp.]
MPAITSLGIGSGLDINTMVSQLVALERRPLDLMRAEATRLQTQVSSYGKLNSLFSSLQDASNKLAGSALWARTVATSSDDSAVMASGGSGAAAGRYAVSVQALAGSQTLASTTAEASADALAGSGSLTLELGRWDGTAFGPKVGASAVTVVITATDTLATMRDKVNASGAGVSASLVSDASGVRLSLRSSATGAENGFRVTVADDDGNSTDASGLSRFAYDAAGSGGGMALKQAAADAQATVNGIDVVSASNELTGVVEGLTLRLRKVTVTPVDVAVQDDNEGAKAAITAFATAYSDLARYIAEQTKYDPASKVGGPLQGDSAVGSLQSQMRAVLNASSGASARFPRLSDIGLELQRDGTLSVDAAKLDAALANPVELKKAFANRDEIVPANNGFARRYADLATQVLGVDGSLTT